MRLDERTEDALSRALAYGLPLSLLLIAAAALPPLLLP